MIKKRIIIGSLIIVVLLGIYAAYRYNQYLLTWQVNPKISVDGIKLMMTENDVKSLIGKEEEYIHGFGGYKLSYQSKGILVTFLNDKDTDFYKKVSEINISNAKYEILGIHVGGKFEKALDTIKTHGFTEEKAEYPGYWKMNMYIIIDKNDSGEVKNITIGIKDRISSGRIY